MNTPGIHRAPRPGAAPRASVCFLSGIVLMLAGCGGGASEAEGRGLDGTFTTLSGFAACQEVDRFHEMMAHVARGESEEYRAMVGDPESGCFLLKGDVDVSVLTWNVTFAEIQPVGAQTSVWTVAEAVKPGENGSGELPAVGGRK